MAAKTKTDEVPNPDAQLAQYWIGEIEASEKWRADYWRRCKAIIQRYKNEWTTSRETSEGQRRFSILYSNVQTLAPSVYARKPEAVVTRRFKDPDPLGRISAEILERATNFSADQYDIDGAFAQCRDDYLIMGQSQLWARYIPHFKTVQPTPDDDEGDDDAGEEAGEGDIQITNNEDDGNEEIVEYEEVICDHVAYDDFGTNPARTWQEVWFVWRRAFLERSELVERFGKEIGNAIPLDYESSHDKNDQDRGERSKAKKAAIYEVWDKRKREVIWISRGYNAKPLDRRDDPLGLTNFYPCPRPLLGTTPPDSIIPVPDYVYYQDQAEEIDDLTARIGVLSDALQVHGVYDAQNDVVLNNVFGQPSNYLIPVENWAMLKDGGGMRGAIEWFPIEQVAEGLRACVELRKQLIDDIYQLTGISDIMRGDTDAEETAAAQGIKATWGSLRVRDRQKEMARFCRDVIRIQAEIIAEKFAPETLQAMTGVKLFRTVKEKQAAQAVITQAQQRAQQGLPAPQIPADIQEMLNEPTWEEVEGLLRSNARRAFCIDIETDSTIEPDEAESKKRLVEFVTATSQLLTAALPILQAFPPAAPMFAEIMKESSRVFRVSRPLEEVVDRIFGQIEQMPPAPMQEAQKGPPPPDPADQQAKLITASANQTKAQAAMLDAQTKARDAAASHTVEMQRTQTDAAISAAELTLRSRELDQKQEALKRDPTPQGVA